jgi:hypothetical protein
MSSNGSRPSVRNGETEVRLLASPCLFVAAQAVQLLGGVFICALRRQRKEQTINEVRGWCARVPPKQITAKQRQNTQGEGGD